MAGQAPTAAAQVAALTVLLDHPVLSSDPLLLCSAAQVCSSWRAAVAAAGAGTTAVVLDNKTKHPQRTAAELADTLLQKVGSFSMWLSKHAPAVHSITVACSHGNTKDLCTAYTMACQTLSLSLQLAATRPRPLRLQRFASSISSSELMAALPASLTELDLSANAFLHFKDRTDCLKVLLRPFQHIHALRIEIKACEEDIAVEALGDLCQLTRLDLDVHDFRTDIFIHLCEALHGLRDLHDLRLALRFTNYGGEEARLQLRDMAALTKLELALSRFPVGAGDWLAMPPNLQSLGATLRLNADQEAGFNPVLAMQLLDLKHLRHLALDCSFGSLTKLPGSVDLLQQLTGLESLELKYSRIEQASEDASAWHKLRGMRSISVIDTSKPDDVVVQLAAHKVVMRHLPALVGLTRLELTVIDKNPAERPFTQPPSHVCHWISSLTRLRNLRLACYGLGKMLDRDCSKLIPLNHLTSLALTNTGKAVDDNVAVALACSMPQLRNLDLTCAGLRSDAFVPAVAQLRHLKRLVLTGIDCYDGRATLKKWAEQLHAYRSAVRMPTVVVLV